MKRKFAGKVRDVKYSQESGMVAALSIGCVKLLDPASDLKVTQTVRCLY